MPILGLFGYICLMKINTNAWNRLRYTFYAPFYNVIANIFSTSRKKSIATLGIKENDKVLLVGAGTGLDLTFLPKNCEIVATDITPSMVKKMVELNEKLGLNASFKIMDGQDLSFEDNSFDYVILHLILAVIPDPVQCLQEVERVLKPNGEIAVFDKFEKKGVPISMLRKLLNVVVNTLFTDITRNIETICSQTQLKIISDESANFKGNFRILKLKKLI
jgi:phosphatidylethanolamine/phosphatidyl-N-methylethanolamine N-methyltransferase